MVSSYLVRGLIKMNFSLAGKIMGTCRVMRLLGAKIGKKTHIHSDIKIYNDDGYRFEKLEIGSNAYIGPRCLFDLSGPILIGDRVSISANVTLITHIDVGSNAIKDYSQRKIGRICIKNDTWVGVNCTILHNTTIGSGCMIGALSLVNKDIPDRSSAFGIPCRVKKNI
jgi:maltose O-acetyltransferase